MSLQKLTCFLEPHPSGISVAQAVLAEVTFQKDALHISFKIQALRHAVCIPDAVLPSLGDSLWLHTCCEAFFALEGQDAYREFNFSPSRQWAAYPFVFYRKRAEKDIPAPDPLINIQVTDTGFNLEAILQLSVLPKKSAGAVLCIGLSAVIESADHTLSYWALHHPSEKPDFHHRDSFLLKLKWVD